MHWQILYRFLPIKRVITNDQRFMGLLSISYVFKNLYFPILLHSFSSVKFLEKFPSPCPFAHLPFHGFIFYFIFFSLSNHPNHVSTNLIRNLKPALICELSLSSAVFCSNPVLITTPISSMYFFSFFDVLPSAPTTTGITLMNSFLFIRTISGFLALIFVSHWIITSHKILTSSFSAAPYRACSYHFSLLFRLYFPHNFQ